MNISSIQVKYFNVASLKENFFYALTPQHKKILLIASFIFGCLAACYVISRCCFKASSLKELESKAWPDKEIEEEKVDELDLEKVMNVDQALYFPVEQKSYQITSDVDRKVFNEYLFSHPKILPQNKILLEHTVFQSTCLSTVIHYHHFMPSAMGFEELLESLPLSKKTKGKITCVPHWFDYTEAHHFYIDFAHPTSFGGAYRSYGCVQEERMFAEFPALSILDFKTQNGIHPCIDSYDQDGHKKYPPIAKPFPFIIEDIHRQFDISKTPYGGYFQKATDDAIVKNIVKVAHPVPVNIIGLAAVDWRGIKNPKYKLEDLIYHFEAAYLANMGAKRLVEQKGWQEAVVHTAPWGCGAFLNSEKMMVALQYLAAQMADVHLVFHGVGNAMNPHYAQDDINQVSQLISQLIKEKKSLQQILKILLEKSHSDSTWAPK